MESSIKYIGVEAIKVSETSGYADNKKSTDIRAGLFCGLKCRTYNGQAVNFIIITNKENKDAVHALNSEKFKIVSIRTLTEQVEELIAFRDTEEDQEKALQMLSKFVGLMGKEKRMVVNDPAIIDVSTYVDVSREFFTPKTNNPTTANSTPGVGHTYNYQAEQRKKDEEKKRQEEMRQTPTMIKREGELPTEKSLELMTQKLKQIAGGDYKRDLPDPEKGGREKTPAGAWQAGQSQFVAG